MNTADDYIADLKGWYSEDEPDGAELLDDIREFLRRFVVYPSDVELNAHTLWIAHCHFMESWDSTPRIAFLSPEPGSGKSRALEVTEPLVPRPVHAVNCTPAYLFRKISDPAGPPTVLYDECDTLFGPKAKEHEEIRGVINAGHRKGAIAGRCVVRGKTVETEELPAYCGVALAGLDDLPDTIMSRSVVVRMRRRAPSESVEPWRRRVNGPDAQRLYQRLLNWSDSATPLENGWPEMPPSVTDRDADVWEALLAVAEMAGGHWPATARATAATAATASRQAKPSLGVLLLRDIRQVFDKGDDQLSTVDILGHLSKIEESPWATIRRGEPLDARGLAYRLGKYGIGPKFLRNESGAPFKGYARTQFEDAWERYLTADAPADEPTPPEGDLSVASVASQFAGSDPATAATDATASSVTEGDIFDESESLFGDESEGSHEERRCACGNQLASPEARATGKCKPCRLRERVA